jgi:hypothetical protein
MLRGQDEMSHDGLTQEMEPAKQFVTFFGLAFSALLPLINPLGDALVFMGLVGAAPAGV